MSKDLQLGTEAAVRCIRDVADRAAQAIGAADTPAGENDSFFASVDGATVQMNEFRAHMHELWALMDHRRDHGGNPVVDEAAYHRTCQMARSLVTAAGLLLHAVREMPVSEDQAKAGTMWLGRVQ